MPTISSERRPLRAAAALLLLAAAGPALAGPTIEIDPRFESFASRAACEQALQRRHGAALARFAALPAKERRGNRVDGLTRREDGHLGYLEVVDLSEGEQDALIPASQTESFTCLDNRLEHRISLGP
jgi:hypothetical protein